MFNKRVVLVTILLIALIVLTFATIATADGTIYWTGQGVTNGELNNVNCNYNTGTLHWIFTGGTATTAKLTVNGTVYQPVKHVGAVHFITGWYKLDPNSTNAYVICTGNATKNPQLTIASEFPPINRTETPAPTKTPDPTL